MIDVVRWGTIIIMWIVIALDVWTFIRGLRLNKENRMLSDRLRHAIDEWMREIEEVVEMNRNLDGCYFRVKRDGKYEAVCFSDLTAEEREEVCKDRPAE